MTLFCREAEGEAVAEAFGAGALDWVTGVILRFGCGMVLCDVKALRQELGVEWVVRSLTLGRSVNGLLSGKRRATISAWSVRNAGFR